MSYSWIGNEIYKLAMIGKIKRIRLKVTSAGKGNGN